jgi:outer membrane protein assembly factor BamB
MWSVTLNGEVSFPLIVGGRVFVTTAQSPGGGSLYALSAETGRVLWGPVAVVGNYYFPLTFGDGRIYVNPFEGAVTAFNATTGAQVWSTSIDPEFESEPVVGGGLVWVEGQNNAYALYEKTGGIANETGLADGMDTVPAVKGQGLYFSTGCQKQYGFTVGGVFRWEHDSNCNGGGGGIAAIWDDRMYGSDGNEILATSDGTLKGTFPGPPAFSGTTGFFVTSSGSVSALDVADKDKPLWTSTLPAAVGSAPVATPAAIWVVTAASKLVALNSETGAVLSTHEVPGTAGVDDLNPASVGIGNNLIVVPIGTTLTAFG